MTKEKINKDARIATLERQAKENLSGQVHNYHFADSALNKAGTDSLIGSGVILELTVLGGRKICSPVLIRDGLSAELIAALRADLVRSYELATMYKPKGAK
jgi:hypothetical protein